MRFPWFLAFLASVVASSINLNVHAQTQSVSLVSGGDYLPYSDRKDPAGGILTDVIRNAFAEQKVEMKLDWQPWARGYDETKKGNFSGAFPYGKSPEREADMIFSDPIFILEARVFIRAGNKKFSFTYPDGFVGTSFCSPIGWAIPAKFVDMVKRGQIKVQSPKDIGACAKLVEADRADFFVTEEPNAKALVAAAGLAPQSIVLAPTPALSEEGIFMIAPKSLATSKDMMATFNKGLAALKKSGKYDKIIKAHDK